MLAPFKKHGSRRLLQTPIFTLREDDAEHPRTGHRQPYYVLENPDWVNVVALTAERELLLVRQYRHGSGAVELELPAGMVEPGELPEAAAARELQEETGYRAGRVTVLGSTLPNAAYQQNRCTSLLAEDCVLAGATHFDADEDLELVRVPVAGVRDLVRSGAMRNSLGLVALLFWLDGAQRLDWPR